MSCYLNDFLSSSVLVDVDNLKELVKGFTKKILNIIEDGKDDKNIKINNLKKDYNELYTGKIDLINKLFKKKLI